MKSCMYLSVFILLFSCSSKDEQFCDCLKTGKELNDFSSSLFTQVITSKIQQQMISLKDKQKSACKDYQTMSGEKMMKLKAECE